MAWAARPRPSTYNPVYGNYTPPTSTVRVPDSHANQTGLYLQDQMEWNQWLLMLGLRHDSSSRPWTARRPAVATTAS